MPTAPPTRAARGAYGVLANGVVAPLGRLLLAPRVEGVGNLPPGGAVVAFNHDGYLDALLATQVTRRHIRFMGAIGVLRLPLIGWILRACGVFAVRRGSGDVGAVERAVALAAAGGLVGIFPEGGLHRRAGLGRLQSGAARIAIAAGVPIVPVAIGGRLLRGRRSGAFVRVGEPIEPEGSARELTARLAASLQALLGDAGERT